MAFECQGSFACILCNIKVDAVQRTRAYVISPSFYSLISLISTTTGRFLVQRTRFEFTLFGLTYSSVTMTATHVMSFPIAKLCYVGNTPFTFISPLKHSTTVKIGVPLYELRHGKGESYNPRFNVIVT